MSSQISPIVYFKGTIVKHFKRETINQNDNDNKFLYVIIDYVTDANTEKTIVIYQALYPPFKTWARPLEEFYGEVDKEKYPDIKQKYRFEIFKENNNEIIN